MELFWIKELVPWPPRDVNVMNLYKAKETGILAMATEAFLS